MTLNCIHSNTTDCNQTLITTIDRTHFYYFLLHLISDKKCYAKHIEKHEFDECTISSLFPPTFSLSSDTKIWFSLQAILMHHSRELWNRIDNFLDRRKKISLLLHNQMHIECWHVGEKKIFYQWQFPPSRKSACTKKYLPIFVSTDCHSRGKNCKLCLQEMEIIAINLQFFQKYFKFPKKCCWSLLKLLKNSKKLNSILFSFSLSSLS